MVELNVSRQRHDAKIVKRRMISPSPLRLPSPELSYTVQQTAQPSELPSLGESRTPFSTQEQIESELQETIQRLNEMRERQSNAPTRLRRQRLP
jgi:hypothetical protein